MNRARSILMGGVMLIAVLFTPPPLGWDDAAADRSTGSSAAEVEASAPSALATARADSLLPDEALAPTSDVPWNPDHVVSANEPWEAVLRFPLRLASLPIAGLGYVARRTMIRAEESNFVPRTQMVLASVPPWLVVAPASLGDRTGFGGQVGVVVPVGDQILRAGLQGSTTKYSRVSLSAARGPVGLSYTYDWRPRERFFGIGLATSDEDASTFAARTQRVLAMAQYPWRTPGKPLPRNVVRAWAGPRESILRRGRDGESFDQMFPATAGLLDLRQEHFTYGLGVVLDTRGGTPHWSHGVRVELRAERFDKAIRALAIRSASTGAPPFTRYSFFAETGVSFLRDPRTIRLSVRGIKQEPGAGAGPLLFPDLAQLGGRAGLAGFEPGRFHDRDMIVTRLAYVFPLARRFELDVHAESGGVYPSLEDARIDTFRNSFGVALRPRTVAPLASIGVDWSSETVRIGFSVGGVE